MQRGRADRNFVEIVKGELGMNAKERRISGTDEESGLREPQASYSNDFEAKNGLRNEWRVSSEQLKITPLGSIASRGDVSLAQPRWAREKNGAGSILFGGAVR